MGTARLNRNATLETMFRLGDVDEGGDLAARAGREPTTPAATFKGRRGYNRKFLKGWTIALPLPLGHGDKDLRKLRRGGTGFELKYQNFSCLISKSRRLPMLTAVNIDGKQSRRLPRITVWSFDGRLDKQDQWGDALYDSNDLDRGHMVRREDPVWGTLASARTANEDTFHFTNSCPQMAGVNQKTWLGLEDYVLKNARVQALRVTVFTGPFFTDKDLQYRGTGVPGSFWKVVAIVTESGRPSATAYRVSQEKELVGLEFKYAGYQTYQISVRQVMDATQLDFGPLLTYDGFSDHEMRTGQPLAERLDTLANIRI